MTRTITNPFDDEHLHEECAIFGIYGNSEAKIRSDIGADSHGFISITGLYRALGETEKNSDDQQFFDAFFTGNYPIKLASGLSGKRVS